MKKNHLLILLFIALTSNIKAQNYWGVDAAVDVANAEFQNTFIQTGTTGSYSTTNWTALSVNDNAGATTPGTAYWTRNTFGYSQGAYTGGSIFAINSPSQTNGAAIFDSDYMDNNGTAGAFGTGTSPGSHRGELISPRIDLTGTTNIPLAVKFFRFFTNFQITDLSISFSSDDGTTWGNSVSYLDDVPVNTTSTNDFKTLELPTSATQGIANLTQCRIKFIFDGYYYFAMVDDITIGSAATLSTNNFTQKKKVTLFPNPSQDYIQMVGLTKTENYSIYNNLGQEIKSGLLSNNKKIDIQNLANGFYVLKLEEGHSFKFMKN